jgi:hypothetical protein
LIRNPTNQIIIISIKDIIKQYQKDAIKEQDPIKLLPFELRDFTDVCLKKVINILPLYYKGVDYYIKLEPNKESN